MQEIVVRGGQRLEGTLDASGAKNAALPVLAATVLTEGTTTLHRVPRLTDVDTMAAILRALGLELEWTGRNDLRVTPTGTGGTVAPRELVRRMRASVCLLGPLLATRGAATMPLPGGCVIGPRPINLHLKGLRALGADIVVDDHQIYARTDGLKGTRVNMTGPHGSTVLGTANVLMAATLAEGETVIEGAAREPEVQDLADYLVACGAEIAGIGTPTIRVAGKDRLRGVEYRLIPDRIEAGTFFCAAAVTGGEVTVRGLRREHMEATLEALQSAGVEITDSDGSVRARAAKPLQPAQLATAPYPGLPTDMQPQLSVMLCLADGISSFEEKVYPDRFTHVPALLRMGAEVDCRGSRAVIHGVEQLHGARVTATDLRAGAALVLAGLAAEGETEISGIDQIERGYQMLVADLRSLGAHIHRREADWCERRSRRSA
ncbi:MAG: UDP-N-acetylglucosamine 1-carboxyvinyltransferase [Candidatus Brocadiia bacterium]